MLNHYDDIISRINEEPKWFDENGVPRYCSFAPDKIANVYAHECALLEISCQECGRVYVVAIDEAKAIAFADTVDTSKKHFILADIIRSHNIHYGDPPNMHCCSAGHTMNSLPRRVLQYWHRMQSTYKKADSDVEYFNLSSIDWTRDQNLEIDIFRPHG